MQQKSSDVSDNINFMGNQSIVSTKVNDCPDFHLKALIEAYLFMNREWVLLSELKVHFVRYSEKKILTALTSLKDDYNYSDGALRLFIYSKDNLLYCKISLKNHLLNHPRLKGFIKKAPYKPLTLKALAFIAYNQPVEKEDLISFLGTSIQSRIKLLLEDHLILAKDVEYQILDKAAKLKTFKTIEYRTSDYFADYFGVENDSEIIRAKMEQFLN